MIYRIRFVQFNITDIQWCTDHYARCEVIGQRREECHNGDEIDAKVFTVQILDFVRRF